MEIEILRSYHEHGTNGKLLIDGQPFCFTIELPWKENKFRISCIPEGRYAVIKRHTRRFGWHLLVLKVPNRTYILVHAFNHAEKECLGCIGPVTKLTGHGQGDLSRIALDKLMDLVTPVLDARKPVFLTIKKSEYEITD